MGPSTGEMERERERERERESSIRRLDSDSVVGSRERALGARNETASSGPHQGCGSSAVMACGDCGAGKRCSFRSCLFHMHDE
jgi:hypothetical protein